VTHLDAPTAAEPDLLRIPEVSADSGLTTGTSLYYDVLWLLQPAARSEGSYRLFDPDDLERLRFIKGLRDDAGFSLAEIGQLLEDDLARVRNRSRFRSTTDATERRAILEDAMGRVDRQVATLQTKIDRLEAMVAEAHARRAHLENHLAEIDAGAEPAPHAHEPRR
jgi:MerR family copper efflux transcriptional regulator